MGNTCMCQHILSHITTILEVRGFDVLQTNVYEPLYTIIYLGEVADLFGRVTGRACRTRHIVVYLFIVPPYHGFRPWGTIFSEASVDKEGRMRHFI